VKNDWRMHCCSQSVYVVLQFMMLRFSSASIIVKLCVRHHLSDVTAVIKTVAGDAGKVRLVDGGLATSAVLKYPNAVGVDASGNVYIADTGNNRIRMVTKSTGIITTVAGDGTEGYSGFKGDGGQAKSARMFYPDAVAVDASGNIYIADKWNSRVRMVTKSTGIISTVAGDGTDGYSGDGGPATSGRLNNPAGIGTDASGNIYIADTDSHRIRLVTKSTGIITTVAGTGILGYSGDRGLATSARLNYPDAVAVDAAGNIYITDTWNNCIRIVTKSTGIINTVAGDGTSGYGGDGGLATSARLYNPSGVAVDASGNIYIADTTNGRVRVVTKSTGIITTVAGTGTSGYGGDGGSAISARLHIPYDVAVDASGNVFIADTDNNRIRLVTKSTGIITTVAGDATSGYSGDGGLAISAIFSDPRGVAFDVSGNIFIADTNNSCIRMVTKSTGIITTVAGDATSGYSGDGGLATSARLYNPHDVAVDASGNIYIVDTYNHRIRMVTKSTGVITTVAGNGISGYSGDGGLATSARLYNPHDVAVDGSGNIYIVDTYNHRIRIVTKSTGVITTVAGNGISGYSGDGGLATSSQLDGPSGVTFDASGNIYICDSGSNRIRIVTKSTGIISTVAGTGALEYTDDGGLATSAKLYHPGGVAVDASGNIFIVDTNSNRIRVVTKITGIVATVAGTGVAGYSGDGGDATLSVLNSPTGISIDASGNIYVIDSGNNRLRVILLGEVSAASPTNSPSVAPSPTNTAYTRTPTPTPSPNTVATPTLTRTPSPTPSPNTVATPVPALTRTPTTSMVSTPTLTRTPSPTFGPNTVSTLGPTFSTITVSPPSLTITPTDSPALAPTPTPTPGPNVVSAPALDMVSTPSPNPIVAPTPSNPIASFVTSASPGMHR
jgi:trimeric autotransporter adhesin